MSTPVADALLHTWEQRPVEEWRERWHLPALVALSHTGSTNDVARAMSDSGAAAGLLVMAEHQTMGRGRMRRTWADAPGQSLLLSFVLRPDRQPAGAHPGTAPIRVGMAVAGALRSLGIDVRLKWPNDVLADDGRKLAGILCEAVTSAGTATIIAGLGINVLQHRDDWPEELRDAAASVAALDGRGGITRAAVVDALVPFMRPLFDRALEPLTRAELQKYGEYDALRGRIVAASGPPQLRGTAVGIAEDGALLLDSVDGTHRVTSGSVRPADISSSRRTAP